MGPIDPMKGEFVLNRGDHFPSRVAHSGRIPLRDFDRHVLAILVISTEPNGRRASPAYL